MCGILGTYNLNGASIDKNSLVEMGNQINHRDPMEKGTLSG